MTRNSRRASSHLHPSLWETRVYKATPASPTESRDERCRPEGELPDRPSTSLRKTTRVPGRSGKDGGSAIEGSHRFPDSYTQRAPKNSFVRERERLRHAPDFHGGHSGRDCGTAEVTRRRRNWRDAPLFARWNTSNTRFPPPARVFSFSPFCSF